MDTFSNVLWPQFNNREIAVIVWFSILSVWLLKHKSVRHSLSGVVKILIHRQILTVLLLLIIYISLLIFGLQWMGLWDAFSHLKDTIAWIVGVALVMVFNVPGTLKGESLFRKAIKDAIKITIILEFVVGLYSLSLPVELILVPFITFLAMMQAVSEVKQEYQGSKNLFQGLLVFIGVLLIWHSVRSLLFDANLIIIERLIEMLMPSILTVLFLPFLYALALYSIYNSVFVRLNTWNPDSKLLGYTKRKIFLHFGFNLGKLAHWSGQNSIHRAKSKEEVLALISNKN
jgi:hypothetical protein